MKHRTLSSLIMILVLSLLVSGCWDRKEIENRELAIAMAVDKAKQGIEVSIQVPIIGNIAGSGESAGGAGGKSTQVFHQQGETLADALTKINGKMDKSLFLGHLSLVFLGEEQARIGIKNILDVMRRDTYIQRRLYPVVAKGKGRRLLEDGTDMEQLKAMFVKNMLETGEKAQATIPFRLHDLLVTLSTPTRKVPILNYIGVVDGKYQWLGLAVFNEDRMIGTLSPEEAIPLLQIREQKVGQRILIKCPVGNGSYQFYPLNMRRKIQVTKEPRIQVLVEIEGRLTEKTCLEQGKENRQKRQLEQQIQQIYQQRANRLIQKAQKDWKLDIFEFGRYIHAYHNSLYQAINWEKTFRKIPIDVSYHVYIRREGTSLN